MKWFVASNGVMFNGVMQALRAVERGTYATLGGRFFCFKRKGRTAQDLDLELVRRQGMAMLNYARDRNSA